MTTVTLAEAGKLTQNDLVSGVIENVVTTNPVFNLIPFEPINGNAKAYNRENALGDVQTLGVGGTITAKTAASFTTVTTTLTTIIGDAEVNGLIIAQGVGDADGSSHAAVQIASKAKSVGRKYQDLWFNGIYTGSPQTGAADFDGLVQLLSAGQSTAYSGTDWFTNLDVMLHSVKSKDGQVDVISMSERDLRTHRRKLRALGGATPERVDVNGVTFEAYAGVIVLPSGYITQSGSPLTDTIYAYNFDDGSEKVGLVGLTSTRNAGLHVESVGPKETADESIWRVKWYCAMAAYSDLALAGLTGVPAD